MPGRGSYGPGGKWIHDRAQRIMDSTQDEYGDKRGKSIAYALATQQAHKVKKTPKKGAGPRGTYGTIRGKIEAKEKHDKPAREYKKTADLTAGKSIRETLEKSAFTMGGQGKDLRQKPPMGMTTNFPTEYSKSFSNKQLNQSQQAAEVGPMPNPAKLMPGGPKLKDLSPPSPTTKGNLPMAKTSQCDPLIEHLKSAMVVEDNKDMKVQGPAPEPELQSGPPGFSPQGVEAARKQREQAIVQLFNSASSSRAFGLDRERPAKKE